MAAQDAITDMVEGAGGAAAHVDAEQGLDSEPTPIAYTVGELIDELSRLPRELEVSTGFNTGAMVCLYNIDKDGMHVEIIEVEPEDDDDWPDEED